MTQPYALISRRRNRSMKIAVGLFMVFTVFVMLFFLWIGQNQLTPFSKTVSFRSKIMNAENIQEGMPVMISGMVVGDVSRLELQSDGTVDMEIRINQKFHPMVTTGTILKLSTYIIGSSKLNLETPKPDLPRLEENGFLPFPSENLAQELMAKLPDQIARIEAILENAEKITRLLSDEKGPMFSTMENLQSTTLVLKNFMDNQIGTAGRITQSMEQYQSILDQLGGLIDEVRQTVTTVRIPLNRLSPIMANIEESTGLSAISSAQLKEILVRANQNMGVVEQILADLKSTIGQVNNFTPELNRMLIETRSLADQASEVLDAAQHSLLLKNAFPKTLRAPVQSDPRIEWPLGTEGE
ncbi:MlaD family protein [uncultured Desulfobacter sp.]|uniref:MlaD family protein n=1 Tax=uncultured Desulfobacter sp. TaxID=240139 RepID=UPI002AAA6E12|nr:MlaD family protein [uncultured Desulfobacter sp.]